MIAAAELVGFDWVVLLGYLMTILWIGFHFYRRNRTAADFTSGGGSLPGWLCGLSIFATYLSSISYLALPGKSYAGDWNPFVFSLALPIAGWIAVRYFVPLYRRCGEVSAYAWFETRFGLWARLCASAFYLLFQIARVGVVIYLTALPMSILFGWSIRSVILVTGVVVIGYSLAGGIRAVIWADAVQAVVLSAGAIIAVIVLLRAIPGGMTEVLAASSESGGSKFSLGSTDLLLVSTPTIWVVLLFGLFENLRNFGVDQSYIQRYIAAESDSAAGKSVWVGALLYVPVSALFFFIGTALFVHYEQSPELKDELRGIVVRQTLREQGVEVGAPEYNPKSDKLLSELADKDISDRVFPHFIATRMPAGLRGLLIAAIFSAAMSTVSTSLNSAATLFTSDFYLRLFRKEADDRRQVRTLRLATIAWGAMGTATSIVLVSSTQNALDIWWVTSGILGAVIIGLFLMGICIPTLQESDAKLATFAGLAVISWMTVTTLDSWPDNLNWAASPFHQLLVIVLGPLVMLALGSLVAQRRKKRSD